MSTELIEEELKPHLDTVLESLLAKSKSCRILHRFARTAAGQTAQAVTGSALQLRKLDVLRKNIFMLLKVLWRIRMCSANVVAIQLSETAADKEYETFLTSCSAL